MRRFLSLFLLIWSALTAFTQTTPTARYATVADMVAARIPAVPAGASGSISALVTGRVTANDGGGGLFFFVPASVTATNLNTVFPSTGVSGRWIRQNGSYVDALWYGATNQSLGIGFSGITDIRPGQGSGQSATDSMLDLLYRNGGILTYNRYLLNGFNHGMDVQDVTNSVGGVHVDTGDPSDASAGGIRYYSIGKGPNSYRVVALTINESTTTGLLAAAPLDFEAYRRDLTQVHQVTNITASGNLMVLKNSDYAVNLWKGSGEQQIYGPQFALDNSATSMRLRYAGGNAINSIGSGMLFEQSFDAVNPTIFPVGAISGRKTVATGSAGGGLSFYHYPSAGPLTETLRTTDQGFVRINNLLASQLVQTDANTNLVSLATVPVSQGGTAATTFTAGVVISPGGTTPLTTQIGTADRLPKWQATSPYLSTTSLIRDTGVHIGIGDGTAVDSGSFGLAVDVRGTNGAALYLRDLNTNPSTEWFAIGFTPSAGYVLQNDNAPVFYFVNAVKAWTMTADGNWQGNIEGKGLQIKEGSNARMGRSVLVNGTVTVANTSVTASTEIFLTRRIRAGTTVGILGVGTVTAATSFVIESVDLAGALSADDDSTVNWLLVEPSP